MQGTLFFVHGTGVRKEGYSRTMDRIQAGMMAAGLGGVTLVGPEWGDEASIDLDETWREQVAKTLPPGLSTRSLTPEDLSDAQVAAAMWDILLEDPLFELRLSGTAAPPESSQILINQPPPGQSMIDLIHRLADEPPSTGKTGIQQAEISDALRSVAASRELDSALGAAENASDLVFVQAVARAAAAFVLSEHRFDEPGTAPAAALDPSMREELVDLIAHALAPGGERFAVPDWIIGPIKDFALARGTAMFRQRREGIMLQRAAPFASDIAFYLHRGISIRDHILGKLANLESPIVAVGHSLGGVMLVDLLSQPNAPKVDLLITVGSQAPLLFTLDSLANLRPGDSDTRPFTPWMNIYNPADFLSFCAERIFSEYGKIWDEAVAPEGISFPEAHSAYWNEGRIYQLIQEHWPGTGR